MKPGHAAACFLFAIMSSALDIPMEFGLAGAALPAAILLALQGRVFAWPFLLALLAAINAAGWGQAAFNPPQGMSLQALLPVWGMMAAFAIVPPLAMLFMARDLPQDGRWLPKYALHVFYPLHMIVLWALGLLFFKSNAHLPF
jgi:hypothetical protein